MCVASAGTGAETVAGALQLSLQGLCPVPKAECPCAPLVLVFALMSGPVSREGVVLVTFASMRGPEVRSSGLQPVSEPSASLRTFSSSPLTPSVSGPLG